MVKDLAVDKERSLALIRKLDRALGKGKLPPERVHLIRTSARRLEALIVNTEKASKYRKLRKRLRGLRRESGAVRDLDVQMVALANLDVDGEQERKSQLMKSLNDSRDERAQELGETLGGRKIRKMRTRLQQWKDEIGAGNGDLDPVPEALRMFARLSRQDSEWSAENLHGYRTKCKRVRYLAEIAGETPAANRVVEPLKRIQDAVGEWHDWQTLTEAAKKLFAGCVESPLVAALLNTTNEKFEAARAVCQESRRVLLEQHRKMPKHERAKRAASKRKPRRATASAVTKVAA